MSDQPEPEPKSKLSLLAQTIQAIGGSAFTLGMGMQQSQARCEFDEAMWEAAASLTMSEFAQVRKLKAAWVSGERWG